MALAASWLKRWMPSSESECTIAQPSLGTIDQRHVLLDAIESLHLEAPPVGPQGRAHAVLRELIGDLVRLDPMMKRRDLETELVGDIEHRRPFRPSGSSASARGCAPHHLDQRFELEVALGLARSLGIGVLRFFLFVDLRAYARIPASCADIPAHQQSLAVARDVAHAGLGSAALVTIDALGILPARHLQALRRAGKLHRSGRSWPPRSSSTTLRPPIKLAEPGRICSVVMPPSSAVSKPGSCGQTECSAQTLRCHRIDRFIAVLSRIHSGTGIHAEM